MIAQGKMNVTRGRGAIVPVILGLLVGVGCNRGGGAGSSTTPPPEPLPIEAVRARAAAAPGDAVAQVELLDWEMHREGGNPEVWEEVAERALILAPENPYVHMMAARAAYLHGDVTAAADAYLDVLELTRGIPEASRLSEVAADGLSDVAGITPNFETLARTRLEALLAEDNRLGPAAVSTISGILIHLANRRGDVDAVQRLSAGMGCITSYRVAGPFGPHVMSGFDQEFDAAGVGPMAESYDLGPHRGQQPTRTIETRGCVANMAEGAPLTGGGTSYAEATVEIPREGDYWLLVDVPASYDLRIDGRSVVRVDRRVTISPRLQFHPVHLGAGSHEVELKFTTRDGTPSAMLALSAANGLRPSASGPSIDGSTYDPSLATAGGESLAGMTLWVAIRQALARGYGLGARELSAGMDRRPGPAMLALAVQVAAAAPFVPEQIERDRVRTLVRRLRELDPAQWNAAQQVAALTAAEGREQEALRMTRQMVERWPHLLPVKLSLVELLVRGGWDGEADTLIEEAKRETPGACDPLYAELSGAQRRSRADEIDRIVQEIVACDAQSYALYEHRIAQRRWDEAAAELERLSRFEPPQARVRLLNAHAEIARSRGNDARLDELLAQMRELAPRNPELVLEQADRAYARGRERDASSLIESALSEHRPAMSGLFLPRRALFARDELSDFRLDGQEVIREFEASGRSYTDPAVLVLDYTVVRVFEDGSTLQLTHNIWRLQSDEAIDEHGEWMPPDAYILKLRTVKADGTRLEPDIIEGKDTISMPNLEIGDYVEYEYVSYHPPQGTYAEGIVGDRFFFRGFEKPYDRSELVVVAPSSFGELTVDPRGDAPETVRESRDDLQVYRWRVDESRPLVREQGSIAPQEYLPSINWGVGATWPELFAMIVDRMRDIDIVDPAHRRLARRIVANLETDGQRARALFDWVHENVEASNQGLFGQAASMVHAEEGHPARVLRYLLGLVDVPAELVLVRSFGADQTSSPLPDTQTYGEVLLRIGEGDAAEYTSVASRGLPFGYIPAALRGQDGVVLNEAAERVTIPAGGPEQDLRTVDIAVSLRPDGSASFRVRETYVGAPAAGWREDLRSVPPAELESRFEEGYVAQVVPGAQLSELTVSGVRERDEPLVLAYAFDVPAVGRIQGNYWMIPQLYGLRLSPAFARDASRTTTQVIGSVALDVRMRVTPPNGVTIEVPGNDMRLRHPSGAQVTVGVAREGADTVISSSVRVPLARVQPSDYDAFARFCRQADEALARELAIRVR